MIEQYLIIGVKIDPKLQEALDHCPPNYQIYFQDNSEYLQIYNINGERILGKKLKPGMNREIFEDYLKNIKSIIKKICPQYSLPESEIKVYIHTLIG